ncbi:MAG: MaoC family dehydratase [Lachnospiraceae bacterium]|nr:MaoC family dehydratase [Lachnospiraceae bacterium]
MNDYTFDEISIGQKESFESTVTEEMLDAFRKLTGDVNPLHASEAYAKEHGYDGRVAYGMLTASFMSALAGVYMPGERSLIKETSIKFVKPVYPGDTVFVEGEVVDKNDTFNMIVLKVTMKNQRGEKVLRGKMDIMVRG